MAGSGRHRVGASPAAVVALALLSFGAGAVGGAIGHHQMSCGCDQAWSRAGGSWKADQMAQWSRVLDLDAEQQKSLEAALDSVQGRYRALYAEMAPRRRELEAELQAKIRAFLDPAQRARYDAAIAANEKRRQAYYRSGEASGADAARPASGEPRTPPPATPQQ